MECDSCDNCNSKSTYEDINGKKLCRLCMSKEGLSFDYDEREFVPQHAPCHDCDDQMEWCDCCGVYTQTCCVDYGTCMCS